METATDHHPEEPAIRELNGIPGSISSGTAGCVDILERISDRAVM